MERAKPSPFLITGGVTMNIFMITRQGNAVQNQVHTMLVAAHSSEEAENIARKWHSPNKEGFSDCKLAITEVELDKSQVIMIQSL